MFNLITLLLCHTSMPLVVLSNSHAMTWPPLYENGVYNVTSGLVPPISQGLKILKLTKMSRALRDSTEWSLSQEVLMPYRNDGAHLTLICLLRDLILRSPNMSHGDLTLGHTLFMLFSWTGSLITFMPFHLLVSLPTACRRSNKTNQQDSSLLHYGQHNHGFASTEPSNRLPSSTSPVGHSSSPAAQQRNSPPQQGVAIDSLQSIRESFHQRAISSKVTNIILQSWSVGTQKNNRPPFVLNGKLIHTIHL